MPTLLLAGDETAEALALGPHEGLQLLDKAAGATPSRLDSVFGERCDIGVARRRPL